MPLNDDLLIQKLKAINPSDGNVVEKMVSALHDYIIGATVTVKKGIPVTTAGSAASQTGQTTAPGTGEIS